MTARFSVVGGEEMRAVAAGLNKLGPILEKIGVTMQRKAATAFKEQRRGSFAWPKRRVPNAPGIVSDVNAGGNPKARRFVGTPAGIDTGRLRNSITWEIRGDAVVIGTAVPYAKVQNEGGESSFTLTRSGRTKLAEVMRRERGGKKRRKKKRSKLASKLASQGVTGAARAQQFDKLNTQDAKGNALLSVGWLFSDDTFTTNVEQRTFLTVTPTDRREIIALIEKEAAKQLKKEAKRGNS